MVAVRHPEWGGITHGVEPEGHARQGQVRVLGAAGGEVVVPQIGGASGDGFSSPCS